MADDTVDIDLQSLKIRELEEIEDAAGRPLGDLFVNGQPMGKALRLVAWVVKKRTDPDFTYEQAGELTINLSSGEPDPTRAAGS